MAYDFRFWDVPVVPSGDEYGVGYDNGQIGKYEKDLILQKVDSYKPVELAMCDGYNPEFRNHHHHLKRRFEFGTGDCNGNDSTTFEDALSEVCLPEGDTLRLAVPFPAFQMHVFSALTMECTAPTEDQGDWELAAGIVNATDPTIFVADITGNAPAAAGTPVDGWIQGEYPHIHQEAGDLLNYTKPYDTNLLYVDITKTPYLVNGEYKFVKDCTDPPCLMFDIRSVMLDTCGQYKKYSCRARCCHPDWKCDPCAEENEDCPPPTDPLCVLTADGSTTGGEKKAAKKSVKKAAKKKAAKKK